MKTQEQLINDCQGLVRSLAWQIHCKLPPHVELDDLIAYGQVGLLEAVRAYDPTRENQFSTYSYYRIRGAIFDGLSKMSWFNRASYMSGEYEHRRKAAKMAKFPEAGKTPEQLVVDCQSLVHSLAWQIHRKVPAHVTLAELEALGQKGLVEAARKYVPSPELRFSTHCYQFVQNAILDGLSKKSWFNRADYHGGVYQQQSRLSAEPPQALASAASEVAPGLTPNNGAAGLVSVICHGFAGGDSEQAVGDDAAQPTPIDAAMQREMLEKLQELIEALPEPARVLIRATYFEGLTLKDAGERLGMSKAWASRLHAKTLDQLAQSFRVSRMAD